MVLPNCTELDGLAVSKPDGAGFVVFVKLFLEGGWILSPTPETIP
jgi:hypothetical protein